MDQDLVQRFPLAKQTYEAAESLGSPLPTHSTQVMRRVEDIIEPDGRRKIAFEAEARSDFIGLGLTVWLEDGELDIAEFYTLDGVVR